MAKTKEAFVCTGCGAVSTKWAGQCGACQQWNTLTETVLATKSSRQASFTGITASVQSLSEVMQDSVERRLTGDPEFDRVLGGGLVPGAVVLIGGDPGIGKSTLLLQTLAHLALENQVLYVTGEESPAQIADRAKRLNLLERNVQLLAETEVHTITKIAMKTKPSIMVIDSIQTMIDDNVPGAPGGVSQVRECAATLARFAKQTNTSILLVGHVTKTGEVAGPRVLEHIVDAVIYMEGQHDGPYRLLRSVKNRFGGVNELGVFAMTEGGIKPVLNPSAIFLSRSDDTNSSGSSVVVIWEGTRPLLVEIQALLDDSHTPAPRRVTVGLDQNRLAMLLAVLHRHAGVVTYDQDVFVNVVGGVRITETAADLSLLAAICSSLKNKPIPKDCVIFGEVGLSGEIRPVPNGQARLQEAAKQGFKQAIIPMGNASKKSFPGLTVQPVKTVSEMLEKLY